MARKKKKQDDLAVRKTVSLPPGFIDRIEKRRAGKPFSTVLADELEQYWLLMARGQKELQGLFLREDLGILVEAVARTMSDTKAKPISTWTSQELFGYIAEGIEDTPLAARKDLCLEKIQNASCACRMALWDLANLYRRNSEMEMSIFLETFL